jgi:hypothetical protein
MAHDQSSQGRDFYIIDERVGFGCNMKFSYIIFCISTLTRETLSFGGYEGFNNGGVAMLPAPYHGSPSRM